MIEPVDLEERLVWIVMIPENQVGDNHLIPHSDIRDHICEESCWCEPVLVDHPIAGPIQQHKALDDRESYISGAKKPH